MPPRHDPPPLSVEHDLLRIREIWGARIRRRRTKLHLTQAELALHVGVTQGEISRIERGERNVSDLDRLALARALGCSHRSLFAYEERSEDAEGAA
jgi:transcriptional regulator with XRE-family HTH domain